MRKSIKQKSASKYMTLNFLIMLRENEYCNKDNGIDYVPCEVDEIYHYKIAKLEKLKEKKIEDDSDKYEIFKMKESKIKYCPKCETDKSWDEFHKDKKKLTFNLQSHCIDCRKLKRKNKNEN